VKNKLCLIAGVTLLIFVWSSGLMAEDKIGFIKWIGVKIE
jgi:hypothetical protein